MNAFYAQHISRKQLIGAIFNELGPICKPTGNTAPVEWQVKQAAEVFHWRYDEERDYPILIGQLELWSPQSCTTKPDFEDILVSNTAIFSAFPAAITQTEPSGQLMLSWQCTLSNGLRSTTLVQIMQTLTELKKALTIRWSLGSLSSSSASNKAWLH
ncbi:MAG: hypothetical protein ACK5NY_10710 [Burkholderiaceae bacterium]